jgi:hypothetical protein
MRLVDHVALNFNSNMSTAAVFFNIKKAFDITWHHGLFYKLPKLEFLTNVIMLINLFPLQIKFRASAVGKGQGMQVGVAQCSVLSPTLYNVYINDTPQLLGVHLTLFAEDNCLYVTNHKEGYVLRKLQ